jgi:hypothetical protein
VLLATAKRVQFRIEEYLARVEILAATITDVSLNLPLSNALLGESPELKQLSGRCAQVHGLLNSALDEMFAKRVSPRELASRFPNIDREVGQLEALTDGIRKSVLAARAA